MTLIPGSRLDFPFEIDARRPARPQSGDLVYVFRSDRRLLVRAEGRSARVPTWGELADAELDLATGDDEVLLLGRLQGTPAYVAAAREAEPVDARTLPANLVFGDLRNLAVRLDEPSFWVGARAVQILEWHRDHRFCGRCAQPTQPHPVDRAKVCPRCGLHVYPRLAPAVIVLVERGDQVLLARSTRFPGGMFSTLAGFVEAGESLEQALVREIEEEVGVRVGNLRYFGSQPWPFPHSLMVGFRATWLAGELTPDPEEIAEAGWFGRDELPPIPPPLSIARSLIDAWIADGESR